MFVTLDWVHFLDAPAWGAATRSDTVVVGQVHIEVADDVFKMYTSSDTI